MLTSSIGIFFSMLIYLLIGSIVYIMYGENLNEDMLDSLTDFTGSNLIILESVFYVLNVLASFPLTFSVLKNYVILGVSLIFTKMEEYKKIV